MVWEKILLQIKFYGIGGQGVVTATKLLAKTVCLFENRYAKTIPAYGHERRGAPVYADIIIDGKEILLNSFIYEPDIVVVLDPFISQIASASTIRDLVYNGVYRYFLQTGTLVGVALFGYLIVYKLLSVFSVNIPRINRIGKGWFFVLFHHYRSSKLMQ